MTMKLTLFSFGYKYGMPTQVNMVVDVRFLPNPYWVENLRPLTGLVEEVSDHAIDSSEGKEFLQLLEPLLGFIVENNRLTSKQEMDIAIGCTGGRHPCAGPSRPGCPVPSGRLPVSGRADGPDPSRQTETPNGVSTGSSVRPRDDGSCRSGGR